MYAKQRLLDSGAHHSYICCCILPLNHCTASRVFGGHAATQGTEGSLFTVSTRYIFVLSRDIENNYCNILKVAFSPELFILLLLEVAFSPELFILLLLEVAFSPELFILLMLEVAFSRELFIY